MGFAQQEKNELLPGEINFYRTGHDLEFHAELSVHLFRVGVVRPYLVQFQLNEYTQLTYLARFENQIVTWCLGGKYWYLLPRHQGRKNITVPSGDSFLLHYTNFGIDL